MKVFLFVASLLFICSLFSCATTYPVKEISLEYNSDIKKIVMMVAVNLWESGIYTDEQINEVGFIDCPIYVEPQEMLFCENEENSNKEGIFKSIIRCPGFMSFDKDHNPFIKIAGKSPAMNKVLVHEFLHYFQWRIEKKNDVVHEDTRVFYKNCPTAACKLEAVETIVDDLLQNNTLQKE